MNPLAKTKVGLAFSTPFNAYLDWQLRAALVRSLPSSSYLLGPQQVTRGGLCLHRLLYAVDRHVLQEENVNGCGNSSLTDGRGIDGGQSR